MVAQSPPYAAQNGSHSAQLFRLAAYSPWRQPGIVNAGDLAVTAQGTPNMSVVVAAGRAWLKGTQVASVSGGSWSTQGGYYGFNDAPVTLTIASADPTNPRIDAVVAYATDSFYSGSTNTFVLGVVTGTPAATPATPTIPNNGLLLGTVAVAANATSISSGNISTAASLMTVTRGGILPVAASDTTSGEYTDQYRAHPTAGFQRWDGSQWAPPRAIAGGRVASTTFTADTAAIGGTETVFDTVTFTAVAGRRYKLTYDAAWVVNTSASTVVFNVRSAAGSSLTASGTLNRGRTATAWSVGNWTDLVVVAELTGLPAGQVTVGLTAQVILGGGTVTMKGAAGNERTLIVEDMGS